MAATKTYNGIYTEVWTEAVLVDGGTAVQIDTTIPVKEAGDLRQVWCKFIMTDVIGVPTVSAFTKTNNAGHVRVSFSNDAAAGNQFTYVIQIQMLHSIQGDFNATSMVDQVLIDAETVDPAALTSTWWVDGTRGSDTTGDGSLNRPLATIRGAYTAATAGDCIRVAPGTYTDATGTLTIAKSIKIFEDKSNTVIWRAAVDAGPVVDITGAHTVQIDLKIQNTSAAAGSMGLRVAPAAGGAAVEFSGEILMGNAAAHSLVVTGNAAAGTTVVMRDCFDNGLLPEFGISGAIDVTLASADDYVLFDRCVLEGGTAAWGQITGNVAGRVTFANCMHVGALTDILDIGGGAACAAIVDIGNSIVSGTIDLDDTTGTGSTASAAILNIAAGGQVGALTATQQNQRIRRWLGGDEWEHGAMHVPLDATTTLTLYTVPLGRTFYPHTVHSYNYTVNSGGALTYRYGGSGAATIVAAVGAAAMNQGVQVETCLADVVPAAGAVVFDVTVASGQAGDDCWPRVRGYLE